MTREAASEGRHSVGQRIVRLRGLNHPKEAPLISGVDRYE
jgi:hypothetical protein